MQQNKIVSRDEWLDSTSHRKAAMKPDPISISRIGCAIHDRYEASGDVNDKGQWVAAPALAGCCH